MPLIRRIPKRGFTFTPKAKYQVVSLETLNLFKTGSEVTPETLRAASIVKRKHPLVKILGGGDLKHPLTVSAHAFSKSALEKIKKAGGKTHEIKAAPAVTV